MHGNYKQINKPKVVPKFNNIIMIGVFILFCVDSVLEGGVSAF